MRAWQVRPAVSARLLSYARGLGVTGTDLLELMITAALPDPRDDRPVTEQSQAAWMLKRLRSGRVRALYDTGIPGGVDTVVVRLPGHSVSSQEGMDREYGADLRCTPEDAFAACGAEGLLLEAPYPRFLVATRLGLVLGTFADIIWDVGSDGRVCPVAGWSLDPGQYRAYPAGSARGPGRPLHGEEPGMVDHDTFCPGTMITYPPGRRLAYRLGTSASAKRAATARFRLRSHRE